MNAVSPITIRPVLRPQFDDTHLGTLDQWVDDNANMLARYWHEQGNALGLSQDDETDFTFWLRVQYDIERSTRRLPHGSSL